MAPGRCSRLYDASPRTSSRRKPSPRSILSFNASRSMVFTTGPFCSVRATLSDGFEDHHWDLAIGFFLVALVGSVHPHELLPKACLLLPPSLSRAYGDLAASDLDRGPRVGLEVEPPDGGLRGAAVGGDDDVAAKVFQVEQGRRSPLTGFSAGGDE